MDGLGLAGLSPRDVQELRHDVRHALDLFEARAGFSAHFILRGDQFDLLQAHRQCRQRGAQLVRGIGGRLTLSRESARHTFTGAGQLLGDQVDFLDAGLLDTGAHTARTDLLSLGGQVDEGSGQIARQGTSHEPADQHRQGHASSEKRARPRNAR